MYRQKHQGKSVLKKLSIALLSGVMVVSLGLAAACVSDDGGGTTTDKTTTAEDTQTILNGNFEFFNDSDDKTHIIYTTDNWSASTSGSTNYVMNGVLDTSAGGWAKISDDGLADTLDYNNNLDEDADNYDDLYVDYNGMRSRDIPYADTYNSLKGSTNGYYTVFEREDGTFYILSDGEETTVTPGSGNGVYTYTDGNGETVTIHDKLLIDNPLTHDVITENPDGTYSYTDENGENVTLYADEDGNYFTDEELTTPYESHVLMIHNYVNTDNGRFGTAQTYSSSTTVTLEPNTSAEISVWVKTANLVYGRNGETPEEGKGAYISVTQTVGGNTIDSFYIENINTSGISENNGWVQFTVFVQGSDFSSSTVSVELGLGRGDNDYADIVEGYAFFDDVTCTVYSDLEKSQAYESALNNNYLNNSTSCDLTDKTDDKVFSYDDFKADGNFSAGYGRNFLVDLTAGGSRIETDLNTQDVTIGLTKDADYYVSASSAPAVYGGAAAKQDSGIQYTNRNLSIDTTEDVLASFTLGSVANLGSASASQYPGLGTYAETIQDIFADASTIIPGANEETSALLLLSSYGAAYTAEITDDANFTVAAGGYTIVSFWVKTSDMNGYTAATVNITDTLDEDINATLSVDTSDITFDVGDEDDIYNGWVQCFFYVHNTYDEARTFKLEFCFGNSTIKDTAASDFMSGYAAMTNLTTFNVDSDVFDLVSTGDYAVSFDFDKTDARENAYMDTVYGSDSEKIKTNISRPSSYDGVNGASASVVSKPNADAGSGGYDARNDYSQAGLINKDNFESYISAAQAEQTESGNVNLDTTSSYYWLQQLIGDGTMLSAIDAAAQAESLWNEIFGTETVQPMLIVSTLRTFADAASAVNYGFIASSATEISSSTYQAVSVRVKVSKGAVAYVYLTDSEHDSVSQFTLPAYSFWYDNAGNVLDSEPDEDDDNYNARDHIVYYLRDDGLYEDKDGKLFANLYNYGRQYYDEEVEYYEQGSSVPTPFEEVDNDVIYYASAEEAAKTDGTGIQAAHYLVTDEGTQVFRYLNGEYSYIVTETNSDGDTVRSYTGPVSNFVIGSGNGGADLRYDNTANAKDLYASVDARYDSQGRLFGVDDITTLDPNSIDVSNLGYDAEGNYVAETWQTVTFYVHTGDVANTYTFELWSGSRDDSGVDSNGNITAYASAPGSYVAFDHSSITIDESGYSSLLNGSTSNPDDGYINKIINAYVRLFNAEGLLSDNPIASAEENIAYYEELFNSFVESGDIVISELESSENAVIRDSYSIIKSYSAMYYTYSLYDDEGYVPFNYETADNDETGYDYSPEDYSETLVYLNYRDTENNAYNIFVDYSATDVTVSTSTTDEPADDETTSTSGTNVWLLIASIVLVVVLVFTLLSLLIRDIIKRKRRNKNYVKNVYTGRRRHYIRKLGLTENAPEEDAGDKPEEGGFDRENPDWHDSDN